jgi:protein involved in polysaccharide export with SLBB domain
MRKHFAIAALSGVMFSGIVGFGQDLSSFFGGGGEQGSGAADCMANPNAPSCSAEAGHSASGALATQQVKAPSIIVDESGTPSFGPKSQLPNGMQAAQAPTEFQNFVASSIGVILPVYGENLFRNPPTTFAPVEQVPVPLDYVIGPGDKLMIRVWGQIDIRESTVVDRAGQIFIPKVGAITLAGVKYANLEDHLKREIGRVFRNFEISASLAQLRTIEIFALGNTKSPGRYTVSSLRTLINALFASGGPSSSGSMRNIELKREGKTIINFDVYDLLVFGDKSKDVPLLPGDVIYIPPVGPQIAPAASTCPPSTKSRARTSGELFAWPAGLHRWPAASN